MAEQRSREGQQLGNYRLERLLGRGGFAEVYLGQHLHLGRPAAIKVLHAYLSEKEVDAFQKEAQIIAGLEHPHIVRVLDFAVQNGVPFLVMEYLPNGTLRQRHPKGEQVPLLTVVSYVKQVAEALHFAHEQRLIHRDVKPENMLIGRRNEIILSDFGIAATAHSTSSMTAQASIGTVPYMAPEQIREHPREASDQYALGIVIYEWLSGELPFNGSFTEIFAKHLMTPPQPLRQKVPALPAEVEEVVSIALAKDPKQRFGNIQAFAMALEQASQATQKPAGAVVEETILPPTVLARPAIATSTDLKTPAMQTLESTGVVPPFAHTPPSTPATPPTTPTEPPPTQRGKPYLTAVILGVFLSLVSILFIDLIGIWARVYPYPTPLQALATPVISLIAGVTLGKRRAALPASLLAGLLIGISGCIFILVKYASILSDLPPYAWFLLVASTVACILISWLAAWISRRTRPLELNKYRRSPAVTVFLVLLALLLLGGASFDIYHNVTEIHSGTLNTLRGVAGSGSQFVAVGTFGTIVTSLDGHTCTTQAFNTSDAFNSVAGSGSQLVAVGYQGVILTSSDGRTWTPQTSGATQLLSGVAWSGSQFVVVGGNGTILSSSDGHTWTPQTSGTSASLSSVVWLGSQFVALGDSILTSPDGRTWTPQTFTSNVNPNSVAWSGSQFVVVGANGAILSSPDGHTWTSQNSGTSQWLSEVVWSGSQFVVVGGSGVILTSPDGHTWTSQNSGTSSYLNSVIWSGSQFVAVGDSGIILTSPDGITWTT